LADSANIFNFLSVSSFMPQTTFVFAKITLFNRLGKSRSGFSSEAALPYHVQKCTKILILVTPYIGKTLIHIGPTFYSILWRVIDSYGAIQQQ